MPADPQTAQLHELAVDAEKNLEQLATGLAQAGANEAAVDALTSMAEAVRRIAKSLVAPEPDPADAADEPPTMNSATDELTSQLAAKRQA